MPHADSNIPAGEVEVLYDEGVEEAKVLMCPLRAIGMVGNISDDEKECYRCVKEDCGWYVKDDSIEGGGCCSLVKIANGV